MLRAFQTAIAAKNAVFSRGYLLSKLKTGAAALKRPLFSFFAMFFLMRAEVMGDIYPLAPAFLAAGLAAGIHPAALCAGCMAGMVRFPLHTSALIPAIACALTLLGELALSFFRTKQPAPEIRCAVLSGTCVMLPALVFAGGEMLPSLQAVSAGAIAAAASPFFMCALKIGKKHRRLMLQEKTGVFLLLAALTGGAYALSPALAAFIGTFAALVLHPMGAVTGVICGLGHLLDGAGPAAIALPAVSGLISGWKIFRARWQRSLCIFSVAALAFFTSWIPPIGILGSLAACILYALLPGRFTEAASILYACPDGNDPDRMARDICEESRMRLTALAEAFGEMAESCTATENLPDEQSLISEMRSRLCSGCAEYPACWNGCDNHAAHFLCALIGEALERVEAPAGMRVIYSDGEIPPEIMRFCRRGRMIPDRLGLLLRDFAEKRRSEIKRCANDQLMAFQFTQAREILYDLAKRQGEALTLSPARREQLAG
ncbi:MAG: hypothetical protein IJA26_05065, partial [Clostridia bacterium]|nr:hypothetical protein [Clostridia bacterium]